MSSRSIVRGLVVAAGLTTLGAASAGSAAPAEPEAAAVRAAEGRRPVKAMLRSFQVHVGLESAGPVLFRDTPDGRLEATSVFAYGGRLAFLFGDELLDLHRLGLGVRWDSLVNSDTRSLSLITPHLAYEIGHPLVLQVGAGYAFARGTEGFAADYAGWATSAALRWSFRRRDDATPLSASLGLVGQVVVPKDHERASAFVGAQVELIFHRPQKGALP
jgi:hypothetical protein